VPDQKFAATQSLHGSILIPASQTLGHAAIVTLEIITMRKIILAVATLLFTAALASSQQQNLSDEGGRVPCS
jgi:hypothetical protein